MEYIKNIEEYMKRYRLMDFCLIIFLFLQPFTHFAGIRNTAFVLLLLLFILRISKGSLRIEYRDRTVQAFLLLVAVSLLSSFLSPYPIDSIHAIRKNLLYQMVLFFVIISEYRGMKTLRPIIYTMILSFAALSVIVILKNGPTILFDWLGHVSRMSPGEKEATFFMGYSLHAIFYIPLTLAYIYSSRDDFKVKGLLVSFIIMEIILVFLNNHRTQLVAVIIATAIITLMAKRYRVLMTALAVIVVAGTIAFQLKPGAFERYRTLLHFRTYATDEHQGWNLRLSIWSGTLDMIRERPVLGYGYGWKKIAWVARDMGNLDRWDKESRTHGYFSTHDYGGANPHNLILQILFEVGIVGLIAFLLFWLTVLIKSLSASGMQGGEGGDFLRYGVSGVLISYAIINISNGLWEETAGNLMTTLAAITIVLYRESLKEG